MTAFDWGPKINQSKNTLQGKQLFNNSFMVTKTFSSDNKSGNPTGQTLTPLTLSSYSHFSIRWTPLGLALSVCLRVKGSKEGRDQL